MTPDRLPRAWEEAFSIRIEDSENFTILAHEEIALKLAPDSEDVLVCHGGQWRACESDPESRLNLLEILQRDNPRVCWVIKSDKIKDSVRLSVLLLLYQQVHNWQLDTFSIGVDESIAEKARSRTFLDNRAASSDAVMQWFRDALLCQDPLDDQKVRAAISFGRTKPEASSAVAAFTLWGDRFGIDVKMLPSGKLHIESLFKGKPRDDRSLALLHASVTFQDVTQASLFRGEAIRKLRDITSQADSYLEMWRRYNELERDMVLQRARDRGVFQYDKLLVSSGTFEFHLRYVAESDTQFQRLAASERVEFDVSAGPPKVILDPAPDVSLKEQLKSLQRISVGHVVRVDLAKRSIYIESDEPDRIRSLIPSTGYLFVSLGGDSRRLQRRDDAEARIRSGANPMPQLGLLLEGQPVNVGRFAKRRGISDKARGMFSNAPTERQIEALEVALNSPDIALIQGPPGTGKTQVIAALQTRLAEVADKDSSIAGQVLLTSYQHDAVVQAASRTKVLGLPAINLSRRNGRLVGDGVDAWKAETMQIVRSRLEVEDGSQYRSLTQLRMHLWSHMHDLHTPEKSIQLLDELETGVGTRLTAAVKDRVNARRDELRRISQFGKDTEADPEIEVVVNSIRGLRTTEQAFSDDGPLKARRVLVRLKDRGVLNEQQVALLTQASEWDDDSGPPFLGELESLKIELINQYSGMQHQSRVDFHDETTREILGVALEELDRSLQDSKVGASAVLSNYLSELENDEEALRGALAGYVAVLAASCQQADSADVSAAKNESPIFETVIVDEAARANPLDLLIPMSMAKRRIVLVGDHRQLPQVIDEQVQQSLQIDKENSDLDPLRESLFERLFRSLKEREKSDGVSRTVTLDAQFRMHPILGNFVSQCFYEAYGDPKIRSDHLDPKDFEHKLPGYEGKCAAWLSLPNGKGAETQPDGHSWARVEEAKVVAHEIKRLAEVSPDFTFGVVSFYGAQVREIWRQLVNLDLAVLDQNEYRIVQKLRYATDHKGRQADRIQIGTVDSLQGKEFDVVLLSLTRSNKHIASLDERAMRKKYGFLTLVNRLCVSMSRQRKLLIVVGDEKMADEIPQSMKNLLPLKVFLELSRGRNAKK